MKIAVVIIALIVALIICYVIYKAINLHKNFTRSKYLSVARMRYKGDRLSFALVILGLALNIFYFITLYKNNNSFYYDYNMGLSVLYNLIFMLIVFMAAEEVKAYRRSFTYIVFIVGCLQIARIFIYPMNALAAGGLSQEKFDLIAIYLCISASFLILASVVSFHHSTALKHLLSGRLQPVEEPEAN